MYHQGECAYHQYMYIEAERERLETAVVDHHRGAIVSNVTFVDVVNLGVSRRLSNQTTVAGVR